jgi:hypothetical protein
MNEQNQMPTQKMAKSHIGKILAIVIAVVVVAGIASYLLQSNYFKGLGDTRLINVEQQLTEPKTTSFPTRVR